MSDEVNDLIDRIADAREKLVEIGFFEAYGTAHELPDPKTARKYQVRLWRVDTLEARLYKLDPSIPTRYKQRVESLGRIGATVSEGQKGRKKQPHVRMRKEIIKRFLPSVADLNDAERLADALGELDRAGVPLPMRGHGGATPRAGNWSSQPKKQTWPTIRETLKKDITEK